MEEWRKYTITAALAWLAGVASTVYTHGDRLARVEVQQTALKAQLDRIETAIERQVNRGK